MTAPELAAATDLNREQAISAVSASVRRLFTIVSEQQARDLAALVLEDLHARGVRLVQGGKPA